MSRSLPYGAALEHEGAVPVDADAPGTHAPISWSPLQACARLRGRPGRVALLSATNDDALGRQSIVAAAPVATLTVRGHRLEVRSADGGVMRTWCGDALRALEDFACDHGADLRNPGAFDAPRLIGWLGYEFGHHVEGLRSRHAADPDLPDLWFGAYDAVARWRDPLTSVRSQGELVGTAAGVARLRALLEAGPGELGPPPSLGPLTGPLADEAAHVQRIEQARAYIAAGDVYQVNLARRLTAEVRRPGDPAAVFAAMLQAAPAPMAALIDLGDIAVISGSPELFLGTRDERLETRPIKGTRRRGPTAEKDAAQRAELEAAAKDAAEHLMIVDLERNDLGRIAEIGSVRVDQFAYPVSLPQVHHLVSRVSARRRADVGLADLLRATYPGGSITGAPKVRAMQIIDELEPVRRGPYCGAIGFLGGAGNLELAIAIRIAVLAGKQLQVHVGGGIVADSEPAHEFDETEAKAEGWRRTLAALAARE